MFACALGENVEQVKFLTYIKSEFYLFFNVKKSKSFFVA